MTVNESSAIERVYFNCLSMDQLINWLFLAALNNVSPGFACEIIKNMVWSATGTRWNISVGFCSVCLVLLVRMYFCQWMDTWLSPLLIELLLISFSSQNRNELALPCTHGKLFWDHRSGPISPWSWARTTVCWAKADDVKGRAVPNAHIYHVSTHVLMDDAELDYWNNVCECWMTVCLQCSYGGVIFVLTVFLVWRQSYQLSPSMTMSHVLKSQIT